MKIVVISTTISQPRVIKRIETLRKLGIELKVYSWDRGIYNCNSVNNNIKVINLGKMNDGRDYVLKIRLLYDGVRKIVKQEGKQNTIYYSFSYVSSLFLAILNTKYIYEISDILYGYKRYQIIKPLLKFIDKKLVKRSELTIMTSQGFYDYLFNKIQDNVLVQPNKLNATFLKAERLSNSLWDLKSLNFGFVGALRYPDTILRFAKQIGENYPNHKFHFYGESSLSTFFKNETKKYSNIFFHGSFKNPEDLTTIYSNIDIIVCCYENKSLNERIAEPNKLYESLFFCKPIVVSKNTFLAEQVKKYSCGYEIDAYSDNAIRYFIDNLNLEDYVSIVKKDFEIKAEELIDNPNNIIDKIQKIITIK